MSTEHEDEYRKILLEIEELYEKKMADYGSDEDPWANLNAADELAVNPWVGVMLRANDKMQRIKSFIKKGKLESESIEDSLIDNANYFVIALALYRVEKRNNAKRKGIMLPGQLP